MIFTAAIERKLQTCNFYSAFLMRSALVYNMVLHLILRQCSILKIYVVQSKVYHDHLSLASNEEAIRRNDLRCQI